MKIHVSSSPRKKILALLSSTCSLLLAFKQKEVCVVVLGTGNVYCKEMGWGR